MSMVGKNTQTAIFGRLIESDDQVLTPELAHHLLRMTFPTSDRERMNELAAKARKGAISEEEDRELERYNVVGDTLALWQSKARRALERRPESVRS